MVKILIILLFPLASFSQANRFSGFGAKAVAGDPDAAAYFTANGVSDASVKSAVETWVLAAKAHSYYTHIKALWFGFMGSAAACKFNFIDPRDLDAAYRLTYTGTITYSSSGMTGNGTTGYANTHFIASTSGLSGTSTGIGYYSGTNSAIGGNHCPIGGYSGAGVSFLQFDITGASFVISGNASSIITWTPVDTRGFYYAVRTGATVFNAYRNDVSLGSNATSATTLPSTETYLLARNANGVANLFSAHQMRIAIITDGFTSTQKTDLYNDFLAMLTTLGIN